MMGLRNRHIGRRLIAGVVMVAAVVLTSIPAIPVAVAAQAPKTRDLADLTRPSIMSTMADAAAAPAPAAATEPFGTTSPLPAATSFSNNPNLQREVFGFVNAGNLGNPSAGYPSWHLNLLST